MRGLPAVSGGDRLRARRWDVLVLGTALPGLVASARLAMHGARVLVVEEESSAAFPGLREPFLVTGAESGSLLGPCMQALGLPLIDRRRLAPSPLAYQVVLPDARVDVGEPTLTVQELVAWGLAKPDDARALVRELGAAARAERAALLATATAPARRLPRTARRPASPIPTTAATSQQRGLPAEVSAASGRLAALLAAQLRALSWLGDAKPAPEAAALLHGVGLEGAPASSSPDTWLRPLIRRRLESLFGEFRAVTEPWRLVSVDRQPGIELTDSREVWVGRTLVINASRVALAAELQRDPLPEFLRAPPATRRRLALHFRVARDELPEAMSSRVVCVGKSEPPLAGSDVVTVRCYPGAKDGDPVDVVAASVIARDEPDVPAREAEIEAALAGLMPFSAGGLTRVARHAARWDDDVWLSDPSAGTAWPGDPRALLSSRPPVFGLERAGVGGLGLDGDLLLGWWAGDVIAAELA